MPGRSDGSSSSTTCAALLNVPRSPSTVRRACGCGSRHIARRSGEPSVTEWTSVVAPPTSTTTRSTDRCREQLGGYEHGAGGGQDEPGRYLGDVLHPRGARDVLLERVVDDRARRQDVELVHRRVDVARHTDAEACLFEQLAGFVAHERVAAVDDDGAHPQLAQATRVGENGVVVAALHASREQDQARPHFVDARQVTVAQRSGGLVLDHAARAQGRLARRHRGHAFGQAVHRHAQAARRRARGQGDPGLEGSQKLLELGAGLGDAHGDVALVHRGHGERLPHEPG